MVSSRPRLHSTPKRFADPNGLAIPLRLPIMDSDMFSTKETSKDEVVLEAKGPLNGDPAGEFQARLDDLVQGPHKAIVLDLAEVESINSSCIGRILLSRKRLSEQGRTIGIRGCSESLHNTFQLIKFDKLIKIER